MEFGLALTINLALFAVYTVMLITFSIDEARRGEKGKAFQAKKAA